MKITFERVRTRQAHLPAEGRRAAKALADFLLREADYRRLAVRFLAQYHTLDQYRRWVADGRPFLVPNRQARGSREELVSLLDLLYRPAASRDPENGRRLLGRLRGFAAQAFVAGLVGRRYRKPDDLFGEDVRVLLDGRVLRSGSRQTIDIAGWHPEEGRGEFYEVKIFPRFLQGPGTLAYLEELRRALGESALVGAVTLHHRETLTAFLRPEEHPSLRFLSLEDIPLLEGGTPF